MTHLAKKCQLHLTILKTNMTGNLPLLHDENVLL